MTMDNLLLCLGFTSLRSYKDYIMPWFQVSSPKDHRSCELNFDIWLTRDLICGCFQNRLLPTLYAHGSLVHMNSEEKL